MRASDVNEYATQLIRSFGDRAPVEAGQRERRARDAGKQDEAEQWRKVLEAIKTRRGAHVS